MRRYWRGVTWWRWRVNLAITRRRYRRSLYLGEMFGAEKNLAALQRLKLNEP